MAHSLLQAAFVFHPYFCASVCGNPTIVQANESPDNCSRMEINERIHAELQGRGMVSNGDHQVRALVP
ncbi:MAG: hypothetical protein ABSD67_19025 [Terracidiphilus sp.]